MDLNQSGIYYIKCLVNNKLYIGLTNNLRKRFNIHKHYLRNNKHDNPYLQNAWNKYNEDNFEFGVFEYCNENLLSEKEIFYINKYNTLDNKYGYNIHQGGEIFNFTNEMKIKSSISHTKNSILQFDLEGNFINKWRNVKEFSVSIGKTIAIRSIYDCCNKNTRRKTYLNYIWVYEQDYLKNGIDLSYYLNRNIKIAKPVLQFDLEDNFISEFKSVYQAGIITGIKKQNIQNCCIGNQKTSGGFIWRYKENYYNTIA